jgi:hypothetical protein
LFTISSFCCGPNHKRFVIWCVFMITFVQCGDTTASSRNLERSVFHMPDRITSNCLQSCMSGIPTNGRVSLLRGRSRLLCLVSDCALMRHRYCRDLQLHKNLLGCFELLAESQGDTAPQLDVNNENHMKNGASNGLIPRPPAHINRAVRQFAASKDEP